MTNDIKNDINKSNILVAVVMGSKSDLPVVEPALKILESFGVSFEVKIISAHRTPLEAHDFASNAKNRGIKVIIGVAGKAAHLAGVLAAYTTLPVIGLPVQTSLMGGLDSLLSMVQMPSGVPVATVAVNGGENAAILAVQMIAISDKTLEEKLVKYKEEIHNKTIIDNASIDEKYNGTKVKDRKIR